MKQEEKNTEILKFIPKELLGNGINTSIEKIDFEKYLKEFESAS